MKLTKQQELFAIEVSKGKSLTDAYLKAYPTSKNWTKNSLWVNASKLASDAKVALRIDSLKTKISNALDEKAIIEVKDIIELHAKIIKSDIKDYLSFKTVDIVLKDDEDGTPRSYSQMGVRIKDSDEVDGKLIKKVSINNKGDFAFELYDKQDSLKEMARIMGLYDDKAKILFPEPLQINVASELDTEQLEDLLKILDRKK